MSWHSAVSSVEGVRAPVAGSMRTPHPHRECPYLSHPSTGFHHRSVHLPKAQSPPHWQRLLTPPGDLSAPGVSVTVGEPLVATDDERTSVRRCCRHGLHPNDGLRLGDLCGMLLFESLERQLRDSPCSKHGSKPIFMGASAKTSHSVLVQRSREASLRALNIKGRKKLLMALQIFAPNKSSPQLPVLVISRCCSGG